MPAVHQDFAEGGYAVALCFGGEAFAQLGLRPRAVRIDPALDHVPAFVVPIADAVDDGRHGRDDARREARRNGGFAGVGLNRAPIYRLVRHHVAGDFLKNGLRPLSRYFLGCGPRDVTPYTPHHGGHRAVTDLPATEAVQSVEQGELTDGV